MTNRRKFLAILGGGVVVAAAAGGVWGATRDPAVARRPWEVAGWNGETEPRRKALSFAVLAPNPHNRQPWVADLSVPDAVMLYCDGERRLPKTDPFDRQIVVGLGCFIELFSLAAAENGFRTDIVLFPDGEPHLRLDARPVARLRLVKDSSVARDPLFAHALARRSNKEAYDISRPVAAESLTLIAAAARTSTVAHTSEPTRVAGLRAEAWDAMWTETTNYETIKESVDLMRVGRAEIEANPDGIDLNGPFIEGLALAGLFRREALLDPQSSAFQQQIPIIREPFDTAMAFLWLTTPGNSRSDQIRAGRDHVRTNLAATALGIGMHPLSQALQEFPKMKPHYDLMRATLEIPEGDTLQMLVRLGYGPDVKASPRWPYETRIRSA